jgi:hypothetical protein
VLQQVLPKEYNLPVIVYGFKGLGFIGSSPGKWLNIVILDACRNNPLKRSFRSGARGLVSLDAPLPDL